MNQNERICRGKKEREKETKRKTDTQEVSKRISRIGESMTIIEKSKRIDFIASLSHDCLFFFFSMSWTRNDKKFLWERSTLGSSNTLRSPPIHRWHFNDDQYLRLFLFEEFLFEAERKRFDNRFCNIRKLLPKEERNHRFVGLLISPSNDLELKYWFYWFSFYFVSNYSIWW